MNVNMDSVFKYGHVKNTSIKVWLNRLWFAHGKLNSNPVTLQGIEKIVLLNGRPNYPGCKGHGIQVTGNFLPLNLLIRVLEMGKGIQVSRGICLKKVWNFDAFFFCWFLVDLIYHTNCWIMLANIFPLRQK